jgi:hypothetical protein
MEKKQWLATSIRDFDNMRNLWIEAITKDPTPQIYNQGADILWYDHEKKALESLYIKNNLEEARQHYYTCGCLDEFRILNYDGKILDYGLNHLAYAMLSDNPSLIKRYADLKHSQYDKMIKNGNTAPTYVLQCLIKDDWDEYERVMPIVKTKSVKKYKLELDAAYYEALADRNKLKIEEILAEFVTPKVHKQRNKYHELVKEFVSHPALAYTKIAWLKGLEVQVNSPYIPMELMPVKPNQDYIEEYDFLKRI